MTKQEFIEKIAAAVIKIAPEFGICVYSPVIAQACLESNYGTSTKGQKNNFFGLKYRENRVSCHSGTFVDGSAEQNPDGSYVSIVDQWYTFATIEDGVRGYFQFINTSRYQNLKGITDPLKYLQILRADGYATSLKYVENVYNTLKSNNLDRFDNKEATMEYTNSSLVTYKNITNNKTSPRNHKIDTITIHCIVGQWTAKQGCDYFANTTRKASCNYVVGKDGSIGLCVDEKDRSWCSSSSENDNRAITIEVASDTSHPYKVTDKALAALIELCADICKRNNIKELKWKGDKSLIGQVDKQNMTVHRWFAAKACPGEYLYNKHSYIAAEVNKRLNISSEPEKPSQPASSELYRVRLSWKDAKSQIGAYSNFENAKKACKENYTVYNSKGEAVYSNVKKEEPAPEFKPYTVKITASELNVRKGPSTKYGIVTVVKKNEVYTIVDENNGWGKLKSGAGWISLAYTQKNGTAASAPVIQNRTYVVKKGDSYWKIAAEQLGKGSRYPEIQKLNNSKALHAGMKILIPLK